MGGRALSSYGAWYDVVEFQTALQKNEVKQSSFVQFGIGIVPCHALWLDGARFPMF